MCCCPAGKDATAAAVDSGTAQAGSNAATALSSEEGGVLDSSNAWGMLAAQLPARIATQPKMLTGGELREYQMQVGGKATQKVAGEKEDPLQPGPG